MLDMFRNTVLIDVLVLACNSIRHRVKPFTIVAWRNENPMSVFAVTLIGFGI